MGANRKPPRKPTYRGAVRVRAIESLLIDRGILTSDAVDLIADVMQNEWRRWPGAEVVARAWIDADFRRRLLAEPGKTLMLEAGGLDTDIVFVENTDTVHNVIVCSLCSCYPLWLLGFPPKWYKSMEYRGRMVMDPRTVLREFGLILPDSVEIRVWDSVSELRYVVLPQAPAAAKNLPPEQLAELVTPELLIGTAR